MDITCITPADVVFEVMSTAEGESANVAADVDVAVEGNRVSISFSVIDTPTRVKQVRVLTNIGGADFPPTSVKVRSPYYCPYFKSSHFCMQAV